MVLLGESRLSVLFWDIYDARLDVQGGTYDSDQPFALSLAYLRDSSGSGIAERSIEEIRQQGFGDESALASWQPSLRKFFQTLYKEMRVSVSVIRLKEFNSF